MSEHPVPRFEQTFKRAQRSRPGRELQRLKTAPAVCQKLEAQNRG